MDGVHELLREQRRAYICGKLGHRLMIALPVQFCDEAREVMIICSTCLEKDWQQMPAKGYQRFKQDLADGKIK